MDSPDSPLAPPPPLPPGPMRGGRAGGGGRGGHPRHVPMDDSVVGGGGHFPPPHNQRRTLLPAATQKFTFHHTRVQEIAQQQARAAERGAHLRKEAQARRGFSSSTLMGDPHRSEVEPEGGSSGEQTSRDPRLHRKASHSSPSSAPTTTTTPAPSTPGPRPKQPDIHLLVHQILSEHSYFRAKTGTSPDLEELRQKRRLAATTGRTIVPSTHLSYVKDKVPTSLLRTKSTKQQGHKPEPSLSMERNVVLVEMSPASSGSGSGSGGSKADLSPTSAEGKVEGASLSDSTSTLPKAVGTCSVHSETLTHFCKSCNELICLSCTNSDRHSGHQHFVLSKLLDTNVRVNLKNLKAVEVKAASLGSVPPSKMDPPSSSPPKAEDRMAEEGTEEEGEMEGVSQQSEDEDSDVSLLGFELDLDTEPSSSEDEGPADDNDPTSYVISLPKLCHWDPRSLLHLQATTGAKRGEEGEEEDEDGLERKTLPLEYPYPLPVMEAPDSEWSITNFDPTKNLMRFSKVDLSRGSGPFHGYMNGQFGPKKLALFASNSSPSGSNRAESGEPSSPIGSGCVNDKGCEEMEDPSSLEELLKRLREEREEGEGSGRGVGAQGRCLVRKRRRRWENTCVSKRKTRKLNMGEDGVSML